MNTTVLTKEALLKTFGEGVTLAVVFEKLHLEWQERGEVVCQFRINGMNLTEQDEYRLASATVSEIESFEVDSQRPDDLLLGVLQNWVTELPTLIQNADYLAQDIRFDGIQDKLNSFVELVDSCQFLIDSLMTLENIVQTQQWTSALEWNENTQLTGRAIGEALKAFEAKNYTVLSEVIEYDLGHCLQVWLNLLKTFLQKVVDERSKDPRITEKLFRKDSSEES